MMGNALINNTIETFVGWDSIVDYESNFESVTLINRNGEKIAEFGYWQFTREDFNRFKNISNPVGKDFNVVVNQDNSYKIIEKN